MKLIHVAFALWAISWVQDPVTAFQSLPLPRSLTVKQNNNVKFYNHKTTSTGLIMASADAAAADADADVVSSEAPIQDEQTGNIFEFPGKGILRDYKMRLPHYASDIMDGLTVQCLAATLFLFFACLAPAIGFGSLFGIATNGAIGTMEMVSSTAFCGIIYALTAAQPLTIIGSTGPVLAFVATMVPLAESFNVPFLPLYAWTGLWTAAILFMAAITSGSNLVRYLTRFTDEIFSVLISTIFVVEAFSDVAGTFTNPASTFTKVCFIFFVLSRQSRCTLFTKTLFVTLSLAPPQGTPDHDVCLDNVHHCNFAERSSQECLFYQENSHDNQQLCAIDCHSDILFGCSLGSHFTGRQSCSSTFSRLTCILRHHKWTTVVNTNF